VALILWKNTILLENFHFFSSLSQEEKKHDKNENWCEIEKRKTWLLKLKILITPKKMLYKCDEDYIKINMKLKDWKFDAFTSIWKIEKLFYFFVLEKSCFFEFFTFIGIENCLTFEFELVNHSFLLLLLKVYYFLKK
jgi:hypothetical protein